MGEAKRDHDEAAVERLTRERDKLLHHLKNVMGLGGELRRLGDGESKQRNKVQKAVWRVAKRIPEDHRDLAVHLRRCISFEGPPTYMGEIQWDLTSE